MMVKLATAALGLVLFAWAVSLIVWRTGLASFSLRKDIARFWRLTDSMAEWLATAFPLHLAFLGGTVSLVAGLALDQSAAVTAGIALLALFGLFLLIRWTRA